MTSSVLVTGGTGTLGRLVVARLRDTGCGVRVLSRRHHEAADGIEFVTGDLATGEGIEPAVDEAGTIVHCAGSSKGDEDKARNLVRRKGGGRCRRQRGATGLRGLRLRGRVDVRGWP